MEAALRASAGIQSLAAQKLKVDRSTICRFIQKHPQLNSVIDDVVAEINDLAVAKLIQNIRDGEFPAIKYYLDNKGQGLGFGIRKLAFSDGEGNTVVPGFLDVPTKPLDYDEWRKRHAPDA